MSGATVSVMSEIPVLTHAQAAWCLGAVREVIAADGVIAPQERQLLAELANQFGVVPSEIGAHDGTAPPTMSAEAEEYVLRLLVLAAFADGELAEVEHETVVRLAGILGIAPPVVDVVIDDLRETVFLSIILGDLENVVLDSERGRKVVGALGLTHDAARRAIDTWRSPR
jgi:uncharacterized tellurite resistance protein B-like protein